VLIELAGVDQMLAWSPGVPDSSELWRRWLHSPAVRRFETGASARDAFAAEVVAEFGLPVDTGEFLDAFTYWPRALYPGATALLDELKPRFRLASVSNTNEIHWRRFGDEWSLPAHFHHNFSVVRRRAPQAGRRLFPSRSRRTRHARRERAVRRRQRDQRRRRRTARHHRAARRGPAGRARRAGRARVASGTKP
jgi:putative hydrolase of the HAD superfamily